MNIFQLIKTVLDFEYQSIPGPEAKKDAAVTARLDGLGRNYKSLATKAPEIDYSDASASRSSISVAISGTTSPASSPSRMPLTPWKKAVESSL